MQPIYKITKKDGTGHSIGNGEDTARTATNHLMNGIGFTIEQLNYGSNPQFVFDSDWTTAEKSLELIAAS